jgi:hypothetical protein
VRLCPCQWAKRSACAIVISMSAIRAHVENGRIIVDDPTDLPDGTVLKLVPVNEGADVDEELDAAWREEIRRRSARIRSGEAKTTPWEEVRKEIFGR